MKVSTVGLIERNALIRQQLKQKCDSSEQSTEVGPSEQLCNVANDKSRIGI